MNSKKKWIIAAAMVGALSTVAGTAFASTTSNTNASASASANKSGAHAHHARGQFSGHFQGNDNYLLSVLKVDQTTLNQDRKSGMSLADIASKNGVTEQTVIDAIVAHEKTAIQQQVTNGKLTSAQAAQREANLSTQAKKMVEAKGFAKGFARGAQGHGPAGFGAFGGDQSYLLSVLKVDQATLKQDRQAGQSLADIASKNGVTEQTVIDAIVAHEKAAIQQQVTNGKLSSTQATQREAKLSDFAKKMVEAKGFHGKRGGWNKQQPKQQQQQATQSSATSSTEE